MSDGNDFDDLRENVFARRADVPAPQPASASTPDVYEARQTSRVSSGSPSPLTASLPPLAIGALIGFLVGFWIFRERD